MAKFPIVKKDGKCYLELPKELGEYVEAELFSLKEGYFLLPKETTIKESEIAILKKLLDIKFERRVPETIEKEFSEAEKLLLKELEKKQLVNLFKGKKYPEGVYNINADVYSLIKSKEIRGPSEFERGYLTISDKEEAVRISKKYSSEMRNGEIIGIKGFDGKFYVVTKAFFEKSQKLILAALIGNMSMNEIAENSNIEIDGCNAVVRIMAENGDILEKKKGVYAAI